MSQHHRADVTAYAAADHSIKGNHGGILRKTYKHVFKPNLSRLEARMQAERITGRKVQMFFYDARNGRASWL